MRSLRSLWLNIPAAWLGGLLAVLALALYWPATGDEFSYFDDQIYYAQNPQVQAGMTGDGFVWAFCTGTASNWHPLTWLSLMLDADLSSRPGDVWLPHFTNVALHALNCWLLLLVLWRATGAKWRSLVVAGLFAVHPLNVETVAWVAERKSVLSMFFFLLALLAYVRYVGESKAQSPRSKVFYGLALLAFALALMSKPMVVTLPFVLLLLDIWPLNRWAGAGGAQVGSSGVAGGGTSQKPAGGYARATLLALVREKWPFFGLSLLACIVTYLVQQHGHAVQSVNRFPLAGRLENALVSYARYLDKAVWPVDLAVFYPYPGHWPALPTGLAAAAVGLACVAAIWLGRKRPWCLVGWFWYVGTLVPVIGLVKVGKQAMADRYAYLPLIGIFMVVVWGGYELLSRARFPRSAMAWLSAIIMAAGAVVARHQLSYWQNDGTLFSHALAVTKNNGQAEVTYGVWLEREKKPAEAAQHYRAAVAIDADDKDAHYDLANVLDDLGQDPAAVTEYQEAIRCNPDYLEAHFNLALVLERLGRRDEAIAEYQTALRLKPDLLAARQHLQGLGVN